jgi:hypothetical protein
MPVRHNTGGRRRTTLVFMTIISLSLWITVATAGAATYYISPAGSDSNSGSSNAPFKTIQKAANIVNPGDTVIVEDGTYTDTDGDGFIVNLNRGGTSSSWVTFKAANKWGAKLDGQNNTTGYGWNFGSSAYYVHVEGFEIYGCGDGGFWLNSSGNHDVDLYQNKVHDIARYYISCTIAELTYGNVGVYTGTSAYNITFDSNVFFNIGRLYGGCTTYDQNHDHALYLYGNNLDIINNVFYDNTAGWDIVLAPGSSNIDVVNNTFVFPNPYRDGHLLLWGNQTNIVIENNTFYKPTTAPINTGSAGTLSNMTLKNNLTTTGGMFSGASTGFTVASNMTGTDPLFVDSTNYDFHLQSTSPAIAKGLTTYAPTYDFDGDTRSGAPDLGAYEYAAAISSTTSTGTTSQATSTSSTSSGTGTELILTGLGSADPTTNFATLQDAYNTATTGDTIEVQTAVLTESPVFNLPISVTIQGGYNSSFSSIGGYTTISGTLSINNGTVIIGNLAIQ